MPPGIRQLIDPGDMMRALLETWYKWLLAGQEGRLQLEQIFQFALVELGGNSIPLTYTEPITGRPKNCCLVWTPQEKTYAQKVTSDALNALQKPAWLDLPPARLQEVYALFSGTVKTQMGNACLSEYQAGASTSLVFSIEHYSPVHTCEVGIQEPLNRYITEDMTEASLENLLNEQLHVGALLEDEPLHAELSLSSFIHYAKTNEWGEAWHRAVVSTYLSHPDDNISNESVRMDTHGILQSKATLHACYECLQEQDPDITFGHDQDCLEFVHQRRLSHCRINWEDAELSNRESNSSEEINIPDFGSDDDDESEDQEDSFRDPGDREPPVLHSTGIHDISHLLTQVSTADSSDFEPLSQKLCAGSPTFLPGDVAHAALKSDSEDKTQVEFPHTILTDISPVKLKPAPASEPPKDELDESVAHQHPKRSIGRSAQAVEAI
ncbi:hypothetical protein FRC11_013457 [Ceratobasidium sp. 423]|nr:hypothetical protein FRC11_013457 [Ceratobasidium sp. 423]